MKPKASFDPEFPARSRLWYRPIPSIGQLMIGIALSGLVLSVVPMRSRRPAPPAFRKPVFQGPVSSRQPRVGQPRDRLVIVAPAEIDPGMVVRADPDLDAELVFNPDTGRRGSSPAAPIPSGGLVVPGPAPAPAPGAPWPQPPVLPQPRPR